MPHTNKTMVNLVVADERVIRMPRIKVDALFNQNLVWWISPNRARMYFAERKAWRSRMSHERGQGGPDTLQLVDV